MILESEIQSRPQGPVSIHIQIQHDRMDGWKDFLQLPYLAGSLLCTPGGYTSSFYCYFNLFSVGKQIISGRVLALAHSHSRPTLVRWLRRSIDSEETPFMHMMGIINIKNKARWTGGGETEQQSNDSNPFLGWHRRRNITIASLADHNRPCMLFIFIMFYYHHRVSRAVVTWRTLALSLSQPTDLAGNLFKFFGY